MVNGKWQMAKSHAVTRALCHLPFTIYHLPFSICIRQDAASSARLRVSVYGGLMMPFSVMMPVM